MQHSPSGVGGSRKDENSGWFLCSSQCFRYFLVEWQEGHRGCNKPAIIIANVFTAEQAQQKTRAKMFFQTDHMQAAKNDFEWTSNSSERGPNTSSVWIWHKSIQQFPRYPTKTLFFVQVTLTFVLDIQTRPSERPNTSSLWIWHESVQRCMTYFIHKQKKSQTAPKNRTLRSSLHVVIKGNTG